MMYKNIQLNKNSYTFDELTHEIQKQTGITFSYNASKISPDQKFKIKSEQMKATQLLAFIEKQSGVGYKIINSGYIVYVPTATVKVSKKQKKSTASKPKPPQQTVKKTKNKSPNSESIIPESSVSVVVNPEGADSSASETVFVFGDSLTVSDYYSSGAASYGKSGKEHNETVHPVHLVMRYPAEEIEDPYRDLSSMKTQRYFQFFSFDNANVTEFFKANILLAGGISADEIYYFNPGIRFGFRFLYASLSYNIGTYPEWRYGIGTEVPLNEKWALQAEWNTGKAIYKNYNFITFDTTFFPPPDSLSPPIPPLIVERNNQIDVVSKLSNISISAKRKLNRNIYLSGGITINRLNSKYFSEGQAYNIDVAGPAILEATNRFQTLKPPYVLSESYNANEAIEIKYWLGIRLSLYWQL